MSRQPSAPSGAGISYGSGKRGPGATAGSGRAASMVVMGLLAEFGRRWSAGDPAAVDEQDLAGDERAAPAEQERDGAHDVVGHPHAPERGGRGVVGGGVGEAAGALGVGEAGGDRVDPDPGGPALPGQRAGQPDDGGLAR